MTRHSWPRVRFAAWPSSLASAFLRFLQPSSAQAAGETVALNIGTLHADQPLVIRFAVKINQAFVGTEVCNQGTVMSGAGMSGAGTPVVTDDPSVVGSADPTCFAVVPPETTPPETTITDTPPNPSKSTAARFTFTGSDNVTPVENLTFECSLDNGDFAPCVTPLEYATLPEGLRIFQVRAVDAVGNVDPSPATFTWNINLVVTRPNLTATNSNDGGGSALLDQPWRWQITINNFGDGAAAFADGELLLLDQLPVAMISYETPTVARSTNVSGVEQIRCTISNADLHCRAEGGPVTIGALTGAITIEFNARATLAGDYANPRPGGRCLVDPDNRIDELDETNNGCADAVKVGLPDLMIAKSHFGDFIRGQEGTQFFMTVSNGGDVQSAGTVQVDDLLPVGLTATAMSGAGWLCTLTPLRCTRSDPLAPGAAYPQITLTVTVAEDAPLELLNEATVTGGSDASPANNKAIDPVQLPVLDYDLFLPVIQRE